MEMLDYLRGRCSDRKLRLFTSACCRRIWSLLVDARSRLAVEVGELHADGKASDDELLTAFINASSFFGSTCCYGTSTGDQAARAACAPAAPKTILIVHEYKISHQRMPDGFRGQGDVLRDVFGNPFRHVFVDPQWLTMNDGAIPRLAEACYDDRELPAGTLVADRFTALAGALEEAGCEEVSILDHCRSSGMHVRGCWVIDLLLGKQ